MKVLTKREPPKKNMNYHQYSFYASKLISNFYPPLMEYFSNYIIIRQRLSLGKLDKVFFLNTFKLFHVFIIGFIRFILVKFRLQKEYNISVKTIINYLSHILVIMENEEDNWNEWDKNSHLYSLFNFSNNQSFQPTRNCNNVLQTRFFFEDKKNSNIFTDFTILK